MQILKPQMLKDTRSIRAFLSLFVLTMLLNDRGKLIDDLGQFQLLAEPQMFKEGYLPAGTSFSRIHTINQSLN